MRPARIYNGVAVLGTMWLLWIVSQMLMSIFERMFFIGTGLWALDLMMAGMFAGELLERKNRHD